MGLSIAELPASIDTAIAIANHDLPLPGEPNIIVPASSSMYGSSKNSGGSNISPATYSPTVWVCNHFSRARLHRESMSSIVSLGIAS